MPPPPELFHRAADIRIVEVLQEAETEHSPQTNGHVAVSGEVEVDLQGVAERTQPSQTQIQLLSSRGKNQVCHGPVLAMTVFWKDLE